MQHLSFKDMQRYVSEEEFTEEYFVWLETVMVHLDECEECAAKIEKLMRIEDVCDDVGSVFSLMKKEQMIRRAYVVDSLENVGMKNFAQRIMQNQVKVYQAVMQDGALKNIIFVDKSSDSMEQFKKENDEQIEFSFADGNLVMIVQCEAGQNVRVASVRMDEVERPVFKQGEWSLPEQAIVVKISLPEQEKFAKANVEREIREKNQSGKMQMAAQYKTMEEIYNKLWEEHGGEYGEKHYIKPSFDENFRIKNREEYEIYIDIE